ncbi:ERCC4 domain-containing protein [Truncatella angustata]|uniref:ERCC4 domain-containing protein n=1 Tax=Truncatella angustata TaxID=152316 RepID=A0A9P8ZYY5_9PEZI|nr:ERCC4 domain-containing protein [Truncatella angustata]KAH6656597.1 ERCC4 domain-containing protein [Truncatella angustata]KAH8201527.1 hypothetical protein TruAng_004298 [Truncatella angustata]
MAPEVICLLSSPSEPSPANAKFPAQNRQAQPHDLQSDDDEFPDISGIVSGTRTSRARATISKGLLKRTNNTGSNGNNGSNQLRQDDNDFLFLSDDFDTTGDLSYHATRNTQASPGATRNKALNARSMMRTSSATVGTKSNCPLQPAGLKRWKSVADPIQHTSSPQRPMAIDLEDDPFASSSPASKTSKGKQPDRATPLSNTSTAGNKLPTMSSKVYDLTSDFSDLSPVQARPSMPKKKSDWDPISSSMPEMSTARNEDSLLPSSPPRPPKRKVDVIDLNNSDRPDSEDEFPELSKVKADTAIISRRASPRSLKRSKTAPANTAAKKPPPKTQEEKELEKKRKAGEREAENERKRIDKERAKREKAIEKDKAKALAEVNKVRVNKSVAQVEMIVDLPKSLSTGLNAQVTTLLNEHSIDHKTWDSPVEHVVRWRRKVDKKFNEEKDYFEPMPLHLEQEKHVLVAIPAAEFVKLATGSEGVDVDAHVLKMKVAFPESSIIYLVEGLDQWFRKNRTARNRQFQNAARHDANSSGAQTRRIAKAYEIVDEDVVEDALLSLQVDHGVLIHKTNAPVETAQWIAIFTQHISTIPYRKLRDDISTDAGFSVESGQVKTGESMKETYVLMLQEVARVTAPMAYGIVAEYPTVTELVRGLEQKGSLALEDLRKSANKDGRLTDQRIGQAISKRLYKIFTSEDPTSTDI